MHKPHVLGVRKIDFRLHTYMEKIEYFETRKGEEVDTYGSKTVPDPYKWLEDPGIFI
jgi:hypothetical protein